MPKFVSVEEYCKGENITYPGLLYRQRKGKVRLANKEILKMTRCVEVPDDWKPKGQ